MHDHTTLHVLSLALCDNSASLYTCCGYFIYFFSFSGRMNSENERERERESECVCGFKTPRFTEHSLYVADGGGNVGICANTQIHRNSYICLYLLCGRQNARFVTFRSSDLSHPTPNPPGTPCRSPRRTATFYEFIDFFWYKNKRREKY